jgi:hypothetical protein
VGKIIKALTIAIQTFLILTFLQDTLFANQPMGPQALLTTLSIVPFTLLMFVLTGAGAAVIYRANRKQKERKASSKGKVRMTDVYQGRQAATIPWSSAWGCSTLFWISIILLVPFFFSGVNEGFGPIWCIVFSIFALFKAIQIFEYGGKRPRGDPPELVGTRKARVFAATAGVTVILFSLFATGVSIAGINYYEGMSVEYAARCLRVLNLQQELYYESHGVYGDVLDVCQFAVGKGYSDRMTYERRYISLEFNLAEDGKSYEATSFNEDQLRPWPFSMVFPTVSLYTNQTGIITVSWIRTSIGRAGPDDTPVQENPAFKNREGSFVLPEKLDKREN